MKINCMNDFVINNKMNSRLKEENIGRLSFPIEYRTLQPQQENAAKIEKEYGKKFEPFGRTSLKQFLHNHEENSYSHRAMTSKKNIQEEEKEVDDQFQEEEEEKMQQRKHLEFIRSYQAWLKDTLAEGYQSARMPNTLGIKKSRLSQKSARKQPIDPQFYQMQIINQYKQSNLFPSRPRSLMKKGSKKPQKLNICKSKSKNEGEFRKMMLRTIEREGFSRKQQKRRSQQLPTRCMPRPASALLRNFSNPKILSIENHQLVTGTKIFLL